jgi:toxin-antitoxin system PIN domain toxin
MFLVDTNVLVYAADTSSPIYKPCRNKLESWRVQRSPWYLTWGILYEFLRVITHPRVFRSPWSPEDAYRFVRVLLASPGLEVLTHGAGHDEVLGELIRSIPELRGNILHDVHTAALMKEHGRTTIYTRDTDFHRFPFLQVLDPVT